MVGAMMYWLLNNFSTNPHWVHKWKAILVTVCDHQQRLLEVGKEAKHTLVHLEVEVYSWFGRGLILLKIL